MTNVEITGADLSDFDWEQREVLYQQAREKYLADIENGSLRYFSIGMENPVAEVSGDLASVSFTSVLNANAYGARGTYRISGAHWFERQNGVWIAVNDPN